MPHVRCPHQACLRSLVYVSSLEVYGEVTDDNHPLTEDRQAIWPSPTLAPVTPWASGPPSVSAMPTPRNGVPVKIARLAQTFGAGVSSGDGRVFAQFARCALRGEDIILHTTGELSRCYCYTTERGSARSICSWRARMARPTTWPTPTPYGPPVADMAVTRLP